MANEMMVACHLTLREGSILDCPGELSGHEKVLTSVGQSQVVSEGCWL